MDNLASVKTVSSGGCAGGSSKGKTAERNAGMQAQVQMIYNLPDA